MTPSEQIDQRLVYMDHAATTPTNPEVREAMLPFFSERFGNPSSLYFLGKQSKDAVTYAREQVACALGCLPEEVYFTAGGTEADNWALKGTAFSMRGKGRHIITTAIEHHAILHTCQYLEACGFEVTYLPVDETGMVAPEEVEEAIRDDTILISVMMANNEVGTIQPVEKIGTIARDHDVLFHTDAVQAIGSVPIDFSSFPADMLSLSAHKFYGPKGVGALIIRKGCTIENFVHGGGQESGMRAGTENLPGVVGLGVAIERITRNISGHNQQITNLRNHLHERITETIPDVRLNGHPTIRLPGNLNLSFYGVEGEAMQLMLSRKGICVSTGSACTSGTEGTSHVLTACGTDPVWARGTLRFSLGNANSEDDVEYMVSCLSEITGRLRKISPLYQ